MRCLVLRLGADVNECGHNGWTPLEIAVKNNDLPSIRCLVEELDADVLQTMSNGTNAVETSKYFYAEDNRVVQYLERETLLLHEHLFVR
jgi:ankyrin repeat protein